MVVSCDWLKYYCRLFVWLLILGGSMWNGPVLTKTVRGEWIYLRPMELLLTARQNLFTSSKIKQNSWPFYQTVIIYSHESKVTKNVWASFSTFCKVTFKNVSEIKYTSQFNKNLLSFFDWKEIVFFLTTLFSNTCLNLQFKMHY